VTISHQTESNYLHNHNDTNSTSLAVSFALPVAPSLSLSLPYWLTESHTKTQLNVTTLNQQPVVPVDGQHLSSASFWSAMLSFSLLLSLLLVPLLLSRRGSGWQLNHPFCRRQTTGLVRRGVSFGCLNDGATFSRAPSTPLQSTPPARPPASQLAAFTRLAGSSVHATGQPAKCHSPASIGPPVASLTAPVS